MKKAIQILFFILPLGLSAQIGLHADGRMGVNTDTPLASLDIRTTDPANPESHEGLLVPKVHEFPSTAPGATRDGMLVYATGSGSVAKGFYYWNQATSAWKQLASPTGTSAVYLDDLQDAKSDGSSVFIGPSAGQNDDGTGNSNVGIGFNALYSNTTGVYNIAHGYRTLLSNTTGNYNIALGYEALYSNTTGYYNIAHGLLALNSNSTGHDNIAQGTWALRSNTTGDQNIAQGNRALSSNTSGNGNIAQGENALRNNTSGDGNIAYGEEALYSNTSGAANIAQGKKALYSNTTGNYNIALGSYALNDNNTGLFNTSLGYSALSSNTTGGSNTALGFIAGSNITTGRNNTAIGANAQVPSDTASNQVRIGNANVTYAGIQVGWTITSDARYKKDITGLNKGLAFVKALRPVNYVRKNNESSTKEMGFIAQEVEKVLESLGYENQGLLSKDDRGMYSLRYNDFIPLLTKAIQEQQEQIASQQGQIDQLAALVGTLAEGQKSEPTPVSGPAEGAVLVSAAAPVPK